MWHLLRPSLNFYTVHIKPDEPDAWQHPILIREGFNWWALFFSGLWALYHRLWLLAGLFLAMNIILMPGLVASWGLTPEGALVLQLGVQACIAFVADDILRHQLRRKGYIIADIVAEQNELLATRRFYDRFVAA